METNLFIKSAVIKNNKVTDIKFYGDWEIETGSGSSGPGGTEIIRIGDGKSFIIDTQDDKVSVQNVYSSFFRLKLIDKKINDNKNFYYAKYVKTKDGTNTALTEFQSIYVSNYTTVEFGQGPSDIEYAVILFYSDAGDYICGYKYTSEYLQSLM